MYAQILFNGLVAGLLLALVAVGFNLIFNTTKVFHLAHGAMFVVGPYALLQFIDITSGIGLWAWGGSVLLVVFLAMLIERVVYQPLARKRSGQAISLISSIGVYLFIVNLISLVYGNETKYVDLPLGGSFSLLGITIIPVQLMQLAIALLLIIGVFILMRTKWFLKVRAITSNDTIASVLGINTEKIRLHTMVLGSIMAGIAGCLQLFDIGIDPHRGMSITLGAVAAVIIGGQTSVKGTIAASLVIAFLQTFTEWYISAHWKEGITFLLLIAVILWRTEGIVSFNIRLEER